MQDLEILNTKNPTTNKTMIDCLNETINHLCKSKYVNRHRLELTQVPIVKQILKSYLSGKKSFILEAPTGVGKSLIGILFAETVSRYCNYYENDEPAAYMLTSSKMLQDQLDIDKIRFDINWAVLKGQGNYICNANNENFTKRECKDMSISGAEKDMPCAKSCKYIVARRQAITYDVAILSYAYWLTSMNFIYETIGSYAPFQKRHITIFDEAHMLSEIVCSMFSTQISENINHTLKTYISTFTKIMPKEDDYEKIIELEKNINNSIHNLLNQSLSVQEMFTYLCEYNEYLNVLIKFIVSTKNRYLKADSKLWSREQRKFEKDSDALMNYCMGVGYFIEENKNDIGMIVKTYEEGFNAKNEKYTKMNLRSLREQDIIKSHCHKYTGFSLFMSATIGDADVFANNNGIEDYEYLYVDSNFNFPDSPIFQIEPPISMAFKDKNSSMPELMRRIEYVCNELHPNERGIIHTGNFEISYKFKEFLYVENIRNYKRFIFYKTSQEKDEAIRKLAKSTNGVIIGPSLTEGLDLKDDMARFSILAKVPYPMLDEYNSRKMKLIKGWYSWKTVTSILQALGRVIRHKDDYAKTYLMDSCFDMVLKYNRFPPYITKRIEPKFVGLINQQKTLNEVENSGLFDYNIATPVEVIKDNIPEKDNFDSDLDYYAKHGVFPPKETKQDDDDLFIDDLPF